ncbi:exosporium leader peptide-containing protein, partial [Bacillus cereus]|uniref:exosporium leader peptide-containing protein n=1 Tax=Bacillus cereus TaxID=1396 RepID=UPI000BFAC9C4
MSKERPSYSYKALHGPALDSDLIGPTFPAIPPFTFPSGPTGNTGATGPSGPTGDTG